MASKCHQCQIVTTLKKITCYACGMELVEKGKAHVAQAMKDEIHELAQNIKEINKGF